MKKSTKTLSFMLALALVLCLLAPAHARAESYRAASWMSPDGGGWQNGAHTFMSYQNYSAYSHKTIYSYCGADGIPIKAAYCIASQNVRSSGDPLNEYGESYITDRWWNDTLSVGDGPGASRKVRDLLSYVLYFGYEGQIASRKGRFTAQEMEDPALLKAFVEALATQILVWEVMVGERNEDFSKHGVDSGKSPVMAIIDPSMPGYQEYFLPKYNGMVSQIQKMLKVPSFLKASAEEAEKLELVWDGSAYRGSLKDTNDCLENWSFSGDGLSFTVQGDELIIRAERLADAGEITITASSAVRGKSMVVQTNAPAYSWDTVQPTVISGTTLSTERRGYVKVWGTPAGELSLIKTSAQAEMTEGNEAYSLEGIRYGVYTSESCSSLARDVQGAEAILTVTASGNSNILRLNPGTYYVKELSVPEGCGYELDDLTVKSVTLRAGEASQLSFSDRPLSDPLGLLLRKITKNGVDVRRVEG